VDESNRPDPRSEPGSLSAIGATLLALVRTRFELIAVELREEALRAQRLFVMAAIGVLFIGAALVLLGLLVAAAFADTHPLLALGGMTLFYAALGTWLVLRLRRSMAEGPMPFSATVGELERDLADLQGRHDLGKQDDAQG